MTFFRNRRPEPKIELLQTHPALRQWPERELAPMACLVDDVTVPAGTVLQKENGLCRAGYIVIEGQVALTQHGRRVGTLGRGDLLGDTRPARARVPQPAAVALTEARVLTMTVPVLLGLREKLQASPAATASPLPGAVRAGARSRARLRSRGGVAVAG